MGSLKETIARLKRVKASLENVRPFYIANLPRWQVRAQKIAETILQNVRPQDTDPETWQRRVATESARIAALLDFSEDIAGAIISMGIVPPDVPTNDPRNYSIGNISVDDVVRWVEQGREKVDPNEPGKNLDDRDSGKTDLQIAWRVLWALKLQKQGWEALSKHILDFVGASEQSVAESFYGEILQAWIAQLGPEMAEQFREWVTLRIREEMA